MDDKGWQVFCVCSCVCVESLLKVTLKSVRLTPQVHVQFKICVLKYIKECMKYRIFVAAAVTNYLKL